MRECRDCLISDSNKNSQKKHLADLHVEGALTSEEAVAQHADLVWQIFSIVWRKWLLACLLEICRGVRHVSLEHPAHQRAATT